MKTEDEIYKQPHDIRHRQAQKFFEAGQQRIKTSPVPKGQKYAPGTRVRIVDDLGPGMSHFPSAKDATVKYTYAHAYGGDDVKSYCIDIDGMGEVSWYYEHQLIPPPSVGYWVVGSNNSRHWAEPCPFCGGEPYQKTLECSSIEDLQRGAWACKECGAQAPECRLGWADGLEKWNKRRCLDTGETKTL
jgi:hypothetical protein